MLEKQMFCSFWSFVKRFGPLCAALAVSISLSGCITFLTEIKVRGDGSGTMVQTMTMNPQQLTEMMDSIAKQMGATLTESKDDTKPKEEPKVKGEPGPDAKKKGPFGEDTLKGKVEDLGPGVSFVSMEEISDKTAAGVRVTYAFKDINQLAMNPKPDAALGMGGAGASSKDALKFRFSRLPNGNASLKIVMPPPEPKEPKKQEDAPPVSPEASGDQLAMVRQMFKGLHMGISIDVDGKVVNTNSPYVEGSKITLMDIDFDPLLADEKGFMSLNKKMEAAKGDDRKTMEILKGIKGLKVITEPEISIEFKPTK